jgi:hypothetical protein
MPPTIVLQPCRQQCVGAGQKSSWARRVRLNRCELQFGGDRLGNLHENELCELGVAKDPAIADGCLRGEGRWLGLDEAAGKGQILDNRLSTGPRALRSSHSGGIGVAWDSASVAAPDWSTSGAVVLRCPRRQGAVRQHLNPCQITVRQRGPGEDHAASPRIQTSTWRFGISMPAASTASFSWRRR